MYSVPVHLCLVWVKPNACVSVCLIDMWMRFDHSSRQLTRPEVNSLSCYIKNLNHIAHKTLQNRLPCWKKLFWCGPKTKFHSHMLTASQWDAPSCSSGSSKNQSVPRTGRRGAWKKGRSCWIITDPPQHGDLPADEQTPLQMAELAGQSLCEWKLISWSLMPVY